MDGLNTEELLSRRAALALAAATPLAGQSGGQSAGRPVIHFEIGCRDLEKTSQYFSELFGWKTRVDGPAADIGGLAAGGIGGHMTALGHEPFHYTIFYVDVEDVKASLARAVQLGGKALVGPITIPTGTFAWFADPEGNMIGLLKPKR